MNLTRAKILKIPKVNPFTIILNYRLHKSWKERLQGIEYVDLEKKVAHYYPRGDIQKFKMESDKTGLFKLLTFLPFIEKDESYDKKGEDSAWEFLGYENEKPILWMSFREFLATKDTKITEKEREFLAIISLIILLGLFIYTKL